MIRSSYFLFFICVDPSYLVLQLRLFFAFSSISRLVYVIRFMFCTPCVVLVLTFVWKISHGLFGTIRLVRSYLCGDANVNTIMFLFPTRVGEKKKNSLKQLQYMCVHSSSNWVCGSGVLFCNKCPSVAGPRFGPVRPNPV